MQFLSGYRTYVTAAVAGLALFAQQAGILTADQTDKLVEALGVLAVVFLRAGIANTAKP